MLKEAYETARDVWRAWMRAGAWLAEPVAVMVELGAFLAVVVLALPVVPLAFVARQAWSYARLATRRLLLSRAPARSQPAAYVTFRGASLSGFAVEEFEDDDPTQPYTRADVRKILEAV